MGRFREIAITTLNVIRVFNLFQLAPPKAGEVRVKVIANALCHTGNSILIGLLLTQY